MKTFVFVALLATVLGFSTLTHANLIDNGGGLIYDTDLNITWYNAPAVARTWDGSMAWAQGLNIGGVTGWRLPTTPGTAPTLETYNITTSEMGHLYYTELGNKAYKDVTGMFRKTGDS